MKYILLFLLIGCASAPQTEQEIYERLARKEEMYDEIRALRNWCHNTAGMIEIYTGRAGSGERRKMYRDVNYIPRHAMKNDFQCGRSRDVLRQLGF